MPIQPPVSPRPRPAPSPAWRAFLVVSVCLAFSAAYEHIEWLVAINSGEASDAFLGTQGDDWDTQKDLFMALIGSIAALATLSRWHDRQLASLRRNPNR